MKHVKVRFNQLLQDSQDLGSTEEHMVSRVFFTIEVDGNSYEDHADIKQTVGADFKTSTLEVSSPAKYKGPFSYDEFRKATETYYRSLIGSQGSGIRVGSGALNIRMRNNTFRGEHAVEFAASEGASFW